MLCNRKHILCTFLTPNPLEFYIFNQIQPTPFSANSMGIFGIFPKMVLKVPVFPLKSHVRSLSLVSILPFLIYSSNRRRHHHRHHHQLRSQSPPSPRAFFPPLSLSSLSLSTNLYLFFIHPDSFLSSNPSFSNSQHSYQNPRISITSPSKLAPFLTPPPKP